ncbi:DUF4760 domain-containing protein [Avibacterium paragallinarum]|uniref:DUF4760 domain-containing protein n=1 Tax=Avibacterium paragallinarum TaxID=728 RepID=A0A380Z7P1_AVIPA|nr:DUF4760 domain-containing protein [Avibacterium paragallinarum]SUV40760.1 Uncharacterised protein [Avibacterium paragallinarum]
MEETVKILGESYGFWVQTGAVLLSAIMAVLAILHNGRMARKRTTIDVLLQENQDKELIAAKFTVFNLARDANNSFVDIYFKEKEKQSDTYKQITMLLNRYEFIAQSIHNKAFEEKIYKQMQYTNITRMWDRLCPLIYEIRQRQNSSTFYQEFEWLATRWKKKPLKAYK